MDSSNFVKKTFNHSCVHGCVCVLNAPGLLRIDKMLYVVYTKCVAETVVARSWHCSTESHRC